MFNSDRTCCVCRSPGKPVQIHHIDDDPSNNDIKNLAILCLDDHNLTQLNGGFGRQLDADQVRLYRDNWVQTVSQRRVTNSYEQEPTSSDPNLELSASLAEIYRENKEWVLLAIHYANIGNDELRDKYVEKALKEDPTDSNVTFLRRLQGRVDLIPESVINHELERNKDWTQKAALLDSLERTSESLIVLLGGILKSLKGGNNFTAAFYLRSLAEGGIITKLYLVAYQDAVDNGELWWQIRVLQDLGWEKELEDLVLEHETEIEESDDISMKQVLARVRGDIGTANNLIKEEAKQTSVKNK